LAGIDSVLAKWGLTFEDNLCIIVAINNQIERDSGCISVRRDDEVEVLLREKDATPGGMHREKSNDQRMPPKPCPGFHLPSHQARDQNRLVTIGTEL